MSLKKKLNLAITQDKKWFRRGVDIWMIRENMDLKLEERIAQLQDTLDTINQIKKSFKPLGRARFTIPPKNINS